MARANSNGSSSSNYKKRQTVKCKVVAKRKKVLTKLPPRRTIVKSARSVWISFLSEIRAQKRPEHANLSFGELCKVLSPVWKQMSTEDKKPYVEAYQRDKLRYAQQMANLSEDQKKILRAHKRRKRKLREGKPKASVSAYMLYVCSARPDVVKQNPDISFQEIGKTLGQQWRNLSEEDRKLYNDKALEDRKRYEREIEEWKKNEELKKQQRRNEREAKLIQRKANAVNTTNNTNETVTVAN